MKNKIVFAFIAVSFLLATVSYAAEFSAEMTSHASGAKIDGKIYVKDNKIRTEMPQAIAITRLDKNVAWILMPDQRMYMEQPIDPKTMAQVTQSVPGEISRQSLGRENVNGQSAEKFRVTYSHGGGEQSMLQWIGDGEIPLKVAAEDGSWSVEYKNIDQGVQADSLFEVPADYRKFAMPSMSDLVNRAAGVE